MKTLWLSILALLGYHTMLKTLTLEEMLQPENKLVFHQHKVLWTSDTEYIFRKSNHEIRKYNAATGNSIVLLNRADLFKLSPYSVESLSNDENYLLLSTYKKRVYRYSSTAYYSVYRININKIEIPLSKVPLQLVVWGAGRSLAYVKDNNVYYVPDCSQPDVITPLTEKGVPGEVYYGIPDWIYEEEVFECAEAMWFSPNGTFLAVAFFNDTLVESATCPYFGDPGNTKFQYPHEIRFKYPMAGRTNPVVGLHVHKPSDPWTEVWDIPAPLSVVGDDHILARVNWASENNLIVLWTNRRQNISALSSCDWLTHNCTIIKKLSELDGWIFIHTPLFDEHTNQLIEIEPQEYYGKRYYHVVKSDLSENYALDMTPGDSTVTEIVAWYGDNDTLYYILSPEDQPWQRQLWMSQTDAQKCVSCRESLCHQVSAIMSTGGSYGVLTCSASSNYSPRIFLYDTQADRLTPIKDNTILEYRYMPIPLFDKILLASNVTAHIKLLLPPDKEKDAKYPMIVKVYAGPGSCLVKDVFNVGNYSRFLVLERNIIVASIDVRGSGVMDVDALHAVNNALGTVEVTDTLEAIRKLVQLYSFIDPSKIGVWGWSYGGFVATMMLIRDDSGAIGCGAAVAPVTNFLYYDSIYTERYMDTPANNPSGYQQADLMAHAENLRGRKYLLVHGTGDNNVHYQNSMQLAKVLQHADIYFEQVVYADEKHNLIGVLSHLYHTMDRFWSECFGIPAHSLKAIPLRNSVSHSVLVSIKSRVHICFIIWVFRILL